MMWVWRGMALGLLLLLLCGYVFSGFLALVGVRRSVGLEWIEQAVEAVLARCE